MNLLGRPNQSGKSEGECVGTGGSTRAEVPPTAFQRSRLAANLRNLPPVPARWKSRQNPQRFSPSGATLETFPHPPRPLENPFRWKIAATLRPGTRYRRGVKFPTDLERVRDFRGRFLRGDGGQSAKSFGKVKDSALWVMRGAMLGNGGERKETCGLMRF
jgi:hypothetical protein